MWRSEDEERDFSEYSGLCKSGLLCGNVYEWNDVKAQITAEAQTPFTTPIAGAVSGLHLRGRSVYPIYFFGRQETNDCTSWGTCNGVDLTQVAQSHRGIETELFRTFKPWVYGVGKCLAGQSADNGMSISLAMKHITQYGVLPEDLPGLPRYSGALQRQLLRDGRAFFNQWKDKAVQYEIDVVRLPLDYEVWLLWASSGRNIVYGTGQRLANRNGEWVRDGSTKHCMTAGFPVRDDGSISNTNSWNDGTGFMKPDIARAVIAQSNSYGAFGIYRIARRNSQPNYSGLGGV
ncbi:MAG: hypothetical protein FWE95_06170 [Planctomycetaceae bacterium]|nr:hypothetical protein [Planctomycetaceae bacterium]